MTGEYSDSDKFRNVHGCVYFSSRSRSSNGFQKAKPNLDQKILGATGVYYIHVDWVWRGIVFCPIGSQLVVILLTTMADGTANPRFAPDSPSPFRREINKHGR